MFALEGDRSGTWEAIGILIYSVLFPTSAQPLPSFNTTGAPPTGAGPAFGVGTPPANTVLVRTVPVTVRLTVTTIGTPALSPAPAPE